jgi:DNA-binding PadR family transcriptional regulator
MSETTPLKRRKVANPLALAVLAFLLTGPMHPYEIARQLKETGKDRNIKYNRGSLYMVVEQLHNAGFIVEHETVRDTQRPERTVYALTSNGRDELYDWMREIVARPRDEYPQFGVALSLLAILEPNESVALLNQRLATLNAEIEATRTIVKGATDQGVEWVFLIEEEYRLALLVAESRFVSKLIESLEAPEYVRTWHQNFEGKIWRE